MVGKIGGLPELLNEDGLGYRGPQLFSWNNREDFNSFAAGDIVDKSPLEDDTPWLLKILMTNFPAFPNEEVLDISAQKSIPYPMSEVEEFQSFLGENLDRIDLEAMQSGTMIFIKLGEDKFDMLNKEEKEYLDGIEHSLQFLKSLNYIRVNDVEINKSHTDTISCKFRIKVGTSEFNSVGLEEKRDKEADILFQMSYAEEVEDILSLKNKPNIYKYFPAIKEVNKIPILLHSNVFALASNRQNLTDAPINYELLKLFAAKICEKMELDKEDNFDNYTLLYKNILLADRLESGWQSPYFYDILLDYIHKNVPTDQREFYPSEDMIIKRTMLDILPGDWGIEKHWFFWKKNDTINAHAKDKEKLGLLRWKISHLIVHGNIEKINEWIKRSSTDEYNLLLKELEADIPDSQFTQLAFLKGNDGSFYSLKMMEDKERLVCMFDEVMKLKSIMIELGFVVMETNFSQYPNLRERIGKEIEYLIDSSGVAYFKRFLNNEEGLPDLDPLDKKQLFQIVSLFPGIERKDLRSWEIFRNRKGETTRLNLSIAPNEKREFWLKRFEIAEDEYFDELDKYLVVEAKVFAKVIHPNWPEIIGDHEFDSENISLLYDPIVNQYLQDEDRDTNLTTGAYIFAKGEFKPHKDIVYHSVLSTFAPYEELTDALKIATDFDCPDKNAVGFLEMEPFKTSNDDIAGLLNSSEFNLAQLTALFKFCQQIDIDVFKYGYFTLDEDIFFFHKSTEIVQYYSDDEKVISFLESQLNESYQLLPTQLHTFRQSGCILRNDELFKAMITQLGDKAFNLEHEFFPLLQHKKLKIDFLRNNPIIPFQIKGTYDKEDYEYLVVDAILANFDEQEFEAITNKIEFTFVEHNIEFYKKDILNTNEVIFDIENKLYHINVSNILPESKVFLKSDMLDKVSQALKRYFPAYKIDQLLALEIESSALMENVVSELEASLEEYLLKTKEQVAFCLLYQLQYGLEYFEKLKVTSADGDIFDLNNQWYCKQYGFLSQHASLSDEFNGLALMLKIDEQRPCFSVGEKCEIIQKPYLQDDKLFFGQIGKALNEDQNIALFDFLFKEFVSRGKDSKRDFEGIESWDLLNANPIQDILGVYLGEIIITNEDGLTIECENAPEWLLNWADSEDKHEMLKTMGVSFNDSEILKLRRSLIPNLDTEIKADTINRSTHSNTHLENTLAWFSHADRFKGTVVTDPEKIDLFSVILINLGEDPEQLWKVDHKELENVVEWDNSFYQSWRDDKDSFEIQLLETDIPYCLIYKTLCFASVNDGKYYFDAEKNIFYCNRNYSVELMLQNAASEDCFESSIIAPLINQGLLVVDQYKLENERLRAQLEKFITPAGDLERGGASKENMQSISEETIRMVREQLTHLEGFDLSGWKGANFPSTLINGITFEQMPIKLIIRSCKSGKLHLTPREWIELSNLRSYLALRVSDNKIEILINPLAELAEANSVINMNFNLDRLTVAGVTEISIGIEKSNIKYVGVGLVVDVPNFSRTIQLAELGLHIQNNGTVSAALGDDF